LFFVGCGTVGRLPHYPFNHSLPALEQLLDQPALDK
jgi:hypothetical protein